MLITFIGPNMTIILRNDLYIYLFNICWYTAKRWVNGLPNLIAWIYWEHSILIAQTFHLQSRRHENV
jgi:hypothetical protein